MTTFKVYWKEGADGPLLDLLDTSSAIEAEAHFLRLIRRRTPGPGVAVIDSRTPQAVAKARYRLDADWTTPREQDLARAAQQWKPDGHPTPFQIRAVATAAGISGAEAAEICGIKSRAWRRWTAPEDEPGHRAMPGAAYQWLLTVLDLHPEYGRR